MEICSSMPAKRQARQEEFPWGRRAKCRSLSGHHGGSKPPSSADSPLPLWGKTGARSRFSPHFVFPSKTQRTFKVAVQPRIPQRKPQLSALRITSVQRNKDEFSENTCSLNHYFLLQVSKPPTLSVPDTASTDTRMLQLRN